MSLSDLAIRRATPSDAAALVALLGEFFDSHAHALPGVFASASSEERAGYIRDLLSGPEHVFVAALGDSVLGAVTVEEVAPPQARLGRQREHHAMIHLLAVSASASRQGIGTRLLQHVRGWARERGFPELRIHVWEFNTAARELYRAEGYATLSRVLTTRP